jgi:hypothetical protein
LIDFQQSKKAAKERILKTDDLRSYVTKYLQDKLAEKLHVPIKRLPWSQMTTEDIINWPMDVKFNQLKKMSINELKRLHELAKEDLLDFSQQFINRLKIKIQMTSERNDLRSAIAKYLGDKLAKKLNVPSIKVPWSQMTTEDIINWPTDVEFKPVKKMIINEIKSLHELAKEDLLDFSTEFISRLENKHIGKGFSEKNDIRSTIAKYLGDKLAKKLNLPSIKVLPWSQMTAGDIINWPTDVEFKPFSKMSTRQIRRLFELAKADKLDFSPEFLKCQLAKSKSAAHELH